MEFQIRLYRPAELDLLYQIDQACFLPGIAYSKRLLRSFLSSPDAECLVAEVGCEIAGFILTDLIDAGGHIVTLDVLEPFRRQGIGAALLRAAEQSLGARGAREVELETATHNAPAIAFWKKHGYRTGGVLKKYYSNRTDAYWMIKSLQEIAE